MWCQATTQAMMTARPPTMLATQMPAIAPALTCVVVKSGLGWQLDKSVLYPDITSKGTHAGVWRF